MALHLPHFFKDHNHQNCLEPRDTDDFRNTTIGVKSSRLKSNVTDQGAGGTVFGIPIAPSELYSTTDHYPTFVWLRSKMKIKMKIKI